MYDLRMKKIAFIILIIFAFANNANSFEYNCYHSTYEKLKFQLDTEKRIYTISFKYSDSVKEFNKRLEPYISSNTDKGLILEKGKITKIENNNLYYFSHIEQNFIFDKKKSIFYIDASNKSESIKAYEKSFGTEGVKKLVTGSIRKCNKI